MTEYTNEYDFDSSDEEDIQNTVGNIPMEWYDKCSHLGYDVTGRPIMKPLSMGAIDKFLDNFENADKSNVIKDPKTGQNIILSEEMILQIKELCSGRMLASAPVNDDEYVTNWFTQDVMETPLTAHPPQKRSFIPSELDKKKVSKIVHAIKTGAIKLPEVEDKEKVWDSEYEYVKNLKIADIYNKDISHESIHREYLEGLPLELRLHATNLSKTIRQIIPPPSLPVPGNEESYFPPPEYLLSKEEKNKLRKRFYDRSINPGRIRYERPQFPRCFPNLRSVPFSNQLIIDKINRVNDLVLSTRVVKSKVSSSTEEMLKQYSIADVDAKPYPNRLAHRVATDDVILSSSISSCGKFLAVIGYKFLSVYEFDGENVCCAMISKRISTSRLVGNSSQTEVTLRNPSVLWHPKLLFLAVALNNQVRIINIAVDMDFENLDLQMRSWWTNSVATRTATDTEEPVIKKPKFVGNWSLENRDTITIGSVKNREFHSCSLVISTEETVLDMSWHSAGDYLLTICGKGKSTNSGGKVHLHRLSMCASQSPFGGNDKGTWLMARFHCQRSVPQLFLAECGSSNIQVFDLARKEYVKTLKVTGNISAIEMHPRENHLVVGTFEGKVYWFDLDMGVTPFKTLNVNLNSVRSICFHRFYPLMACTTANGSAVVFYSKVFDSLDKNPIIIPKHIFSKIDKADDMFSACFHPTTANLICGGADKSIMMLGSEH